MPLPSKRLTLLDAGWLMMETPESPMHVASLQLFELPADASPDYMATLYASLLEGAPFCAPFNRKLRSRLPLSLDARWITDENIDIEYHVRHSALPYPGRVRELLALVSRLHSHRLDRQRPMWECHLIEGLEGNRFALYTKMHHAMIDGVAGSRLLQSRMNLAPQQARVSPWSAQWEKPSSARQPGKAASGVMEQLRSIGRTLLQVIAMARLPREGNARTIYQAPKTLFNRRITGARRFAAQSWSMSRIKAIAARHQATVNDIFLAMSAGCLREYLLSQNALPAEPLVAQVPVSLRTIDQAEEAGNAITTLQVSLATHVADPVARLAAIKDSVQSGKARIGAMSANDLFTFTAITNLPLTIGQMTHLSGRLRRPMFNIVISNVPGAKETLYFGDAKLLATYPVSLIWHGYAVNITLLSYGDSLDIGITACRNTVPRVQRMLDYLENALVALEA
jgi:diacylglycerol O-acyltransferase